MLDPDEGSISVVHARAVDAVNRKIRTRVANPKINLPLVKFFFKVKISFEN